MAFHIEGGEANKIIPSDLLKYQLHEKLILKLTKYEHVNFFQKSFES